MPDQPLPQPGREPVTEHVIADLQARTERGIATYGRPLETHNGRSALQDLYEELLDATQYCKQLLMERGTAALDRDALIHTAASAFGIVLQPNDHRTPQMFGRVVDAVLAAAYPVLMEERERWERELAIVRRALEHYAETEWIEIIDSEGQQTWAYPTGPDIARKALTDTAGTKTEEHIKWLHWNWETWRRVSYQLSEQTEAAIQHAKQAEQIIATAREVVSAFTAPERSLEALSTAYDRLTVALATYDMTRQKEEAHGS